MLLSEDAPAPGLLLLKSVYEDCSFSLSAFDHLRPRQTSAAGQHCDRSILFGYAPTSPSGLATPRLDDSASGAQTIKTESPYLRVSDTALAARQEPTHQRGTKISSMSGPYYHFDPSTLPHASNIASAFSSPPAVGGNSPLPTMKAETVSPVPGFSHPWSGEAQSEKAPLQSPSAQTAYQTLYALPRESLQSIQHHESPIPLHSHAQGNTTAQYLHRASISGPVMDSLTYHSNRAEQMVAPAPPRVHGLAAWENASGSARPHTADGLFGHFAFGPGAQSHDGSLDGSIVPPSFGHASRPYTPAGLNAPADPYFQQRRFSLPDSDGGGSSGNGSKIFSYMPPLEDGSANAVNSSSSYNGHYFGHMNGFHANSGKKRPRRRYDEIERLYSCSWSGCNKSYGTLNHLNAHVAMQKHGPKRAPTEFKDMRKAWRKQKKDDEQRRQSRHASFADAGRKDLTRTNGQSAFVHSVHNGSSNTASAVVGESPLMAGFGPAVAQPALTASGQQAQSAFGAQLSRYSMSSVAEAPAPAAQPFLFQANGSDFQQPHQVPQPQYAINSASHSHELSGHGIGTNDGRPNTGQQVVYPHHNFGAYMSAHRGSI